VAKRKRASKGGVSTESAPIPVVGLRELRLGAGLTQTDVATRMGVSQRRVSAVESTSTPALELRTLIAYVQALGGSVSVVAELEAAHPGSASRAVLHTSAP
jgi:transcriptional regulator with XRE-family HTH domain